MALQERQSLNQRILGRLRGITAQPTVDDAGTDKPAVERSPVEQPGVGEADLPYVAKEGERVDAAAQRAEAERVERARSDPTAFGALYETYVERVYAYIYHRVGNIQDAEDLTARTFYRALDSLDSYEDRGAPFSAWLFRIAHNLVANHHRDHSRRHFLSLDRLWFHSQEGDSPLQQLEQEETRAALWSAINRLPEERRNLLIFKFGSQLSNLEIGEMMNKSESAIKSLYFRTLAALRQDLEARGWGSGQTETPADRPVPMEVTK
ncbi:MAG: sigma-70 family RNA polymerase sigma factor [Caldilineaceae bacterium]|nr:sigma-70 family RNA polymerase sigma factor [Caldilineaceae bacterium]